MNSSTPTSAAADAQASPAASAVGTTAAVPASTAASSHTRKGNLSLGQYYALQKEKRAAKSSYAVDPKELFGDEEDLIGYEKDPEEGELEDKAPAPVSYSEDTHDPPLGSRRPREEAPDASSSKRPRSDDEASPMSRVLISPRTDPPSVRAPWMPSEAEIQVRFGASYPPNPILLYHDSRIIDDEVAKNTVFESPTRRRDYYVRLFHELRYFSAKKPSRKSKAPELHALCQSWNAFVDNFNKATKAYREHVDNARERYYTYTVRGGCERLHGLCMEAGIPCAVSFGTSYPCCLPLAARLSESDLTGYTSVRVPDHIKELRTRIEPREAPSAVADRSTPRAGLNPASYGGLRTPSPFPERPSLGRSVVPMNLDGEEILSSEFENDDFDGSSSYDPRSAQLSSGSLLSRRATAADGVGTLPAYGQRYDHHDRALHDRVAALEHSQSAKIASLRQEERNLRADAAEAAQTASNLSSSLGSRLNLYVERLREFEEAF